MAPAITWEAAENAIQKWVRERSGIPGARVIWPYQGGPIPAKPYIALSIDGIRGVGQAWKSKVDAPAPQTAGQELIIRVNQHMTATLEVQLLADMPESSSATAAADGRLAIEKLTDVVAGVDLHEDELDAGGVGIGEFTPVQWVGPGGGGILEPRAIFTVQLHLGSQLERYETYVERMLMTVTAKQPGLADVVILNEVDLEP